MSNAQNNGSDSTDYGTFSHPRQDLLSSIVVFLVALPLCMGIAIASGVPVAAGLITGIVGGLIVGWFAGSPLQVSGPAAGLTVIVFDLVQRYGIEVLGIAVLIGGILQLLAGLLRYGRWFRAVSPAVIYGMLAGIGVLIASSQFHVMVDDAPRGSGLKNLVSIPEAIEKGMEMSPLGTVEERKMRTDLLHQIGAIHEQQVQLRERAAELIPVQDPNAREEAWEIDPPDFSAILVDQKGLSDRLAELSKQLAEPIVENSVPDAEALRAATETALSNMEVAIADLEGGNVRHVRASQADMQVSIEAVLAELKNHDWAAKIGLLTIIVLILWSTLSPKKLRMVPAPLVAVVVATVVTAFLQLPVFYVELPDNLFSEIHYPSLTVLKSVPAGAVIQAGIVLAAVASAETLLCATAVDQMHNGPRTQYDRELAAQGIGNIVCGFLGALPMTGVIVRSSANVDSGAKTRLSTILHGLWLLVFVAALAFVLRMIPTAALAAMLVYTGYKLLNLKAIAKLYSYGWGEVAIYCVTLGTIVATDLLTGVLAGIGLSALRLLHTFSRLDVHLDVDEEKRTANLSLEGAATFIRLPVLASELERVPNDCELHVEFEHLNYIDHACLDLLTNWAKQHEGTGGKLVIDWDSLHMNFNRGSKSNGEEAAA